MRSAAFLLLSVILVAAAGTTASAQVTLKLDKGDYVGGNPIQVTIEVAAGQSIAAPRFHFINDGAPLPKRNSPGWIEFPRITTAQQVTLRAPKTADPEGSASWWLILNDGDRLVARMPFDEVGFILALKLKAAALSSIATSSPDATANDVASASPATPVESGTSAPAAPAGLLSKNNHMSIASSRDLLMGEVVVVTVTLPALPPGMETIALKWGSSVDLPWEEKETAPESGHSIGAVVPARSPAPQQISVTAPLSTPGRRELRLFVGSQLLDVLMITIG